MVSRDLIKGHNQTERLSDIRERCLQLNDSHKEPNWPLLIVNREKHVVMCGIAKAASTTWLRVFLLLTGKPRAVNLALKSRYVLHMEVEAFLGSMFYMNRSQREKYLTGNYYRIMVVRDPLDRLISAYRDKMFRHKIYAGLWRKIKRMFRPNVSERLCGIYTLLSYTLHFLLSFPKQNLITIY